MSSEFENYLIDLAEHEQDKSLALLENNPNETIKVFAGHKLNWLGDFFGNSKIIWAKKSIPLNQIKFTGTSPELNEILLEKAHRSPEKLIELVGSNKITKQTIEKHATYSDHLIVVRNEFDTGKYLMLDGTHRLLGLILSGVNEVSVWYPVNEREFLPECEAHVIYDLIRGYLRNAKDEQGKIELYHALRLLDRTYGNVADLLKNRFSEKYMFDSGVQEIIRTILN